MHRPRRLKITDVNPHLLCVLCGGYYVDATTIIECLHSFCKACIVRYLETNKYCPICDVQVHKTRPLQNIRSDQTLQDIVYKLVPGLFQNEMCCRREFYAKHPEAQPTSPFDQGEVGDQSHIYTPDESISLSLEYFNSNTSDQEECPTRRYLRCPAAVTIAHLQKLIRAKYGLSAEHRVDIMHIDDSLNEEFTLMDVAYIYRWRRKGPLHLSYRIFECCHMSNKKIKLDHSPFQNVTMASIKEENQLATKPEPMDIDLTGTAVEPKPEKLETTQRVKHTTSKEENNNGSTESWKEVQIQISENGVMSVTDITLPPVVESNNNTVTNFVPVSEAGSKLLISCGNEEKTKPLEGVQKQSKHSIVSKELEHSKSQIMEEISRTSASISPITTTTTTTNTSTQISSTVTCTTVPTPTTKTLSGSKKHELTKTSPSIVESIAKLSAIETVTTKSCDTNPSAKQNDLSSVPITCAPTSPHLAPSTVSSSSIVSNVTSSQQRTEFTACNKRSSDNTTKNTKSACLGPEAQNSGVVTPHLKHPQITQSQPLALKVGQTSVTTSNKAKDGVGIVSKRDAPKMAIVAPTQSMVTNSATNRKTLNSSSSSPIGYKTLKTPPKSWNQSITRLSFLSSAKNHTYMTNASGASCDGRRSSDPTVKGVDNAGGVGSSNKLVGSGNNTIPTKPNRFFKMRNMPRYLGNPASGVKPMYQVASLNKPELGIQTPGQTSGTKPMYQVASAASQHSSLLSHTSAGNLKPLYHVAGSGGNNKLDSAVSSSVTHTTSSKSSMAGYNVGNQQGSKLDTSSISHSCLTTPCVKHQVSQPSTNKQDCSVSTQSITQTSDIKPISSGVSVSSQQHFNKIQDSVTTVPITTLASSSSKSMPSMCSAHSSGSNLLNASSSGKCRGSSKQESGLAHISGVKSTHQIGSVTPIKQDSLSTPLSKHGITLMKIDPKTLSPIVGTTSSPGTPPLSLSPSAQSSNPLPSSMTPQNLKPHPQPFPLPAHSNSNRGTASPNNPLGSPFLPNLLYSSFSFPGMGVGVGGNRMGTGPPPLVRAGSGIGLGAFHPLPPSINMLFNPHHRSHTHNSTSAPGVQPGIVPPPAVQRIPATNPQHKNNSNTNNAVSCSNNNININAPVLNKPSTNSTAGQLSSPNVLHQRTPPLPSHTTSASQQSKSQPSQSTSNQNSTTTQASSLQAATMTGSNHQKPTEGKAQKKTVADSSSVSLIRTVNGEQSSVEVLGKKSGSETTSEIAGEGGKPLNGSKDNREQGSSNCSSSSGSKASSSSGGGRVAEQGIASVNNLTSKNNVSTGDSESERKSSVGKREVVDVTQNQTKLKQDRRETGSNKGNDSGGALEIKKQLEKT